MNKVILKTIGIFTTAVFALVFIYVLKPDPIWETNAKEFARSFNLISGSARIDNLAEFTPFEWDRMYSFTPYTRNEYVYEVVGYEWDRIHETVSEGMNQIVFMKDGKVVCYLDGYSEKYGVLFYFGDYEGNHIELSPSNPLAFDMTTTENGVRIFTYLQ